jgi:hypothetical protein
MSTRIEKVVCRAFLMQRFFFRPFLVSEFFTGHYTHDPLRTSTASTEEKSPNLDRASLLPATPLLVALVRLRIFSRTQQLSLQAQ